MAAFLGVAIDRANDNAAYAFATLSGSPVDLLVGIDGALYVLTPRRRDANQRALKGMSAGMPAPKACEIQRCAIRAARRPQTRLACADVRQ